MALSHSRFALALVGAVALNLQGCDVQTHVNSFVGVVCKTTMTKIVEAAEIHYEKQVDEKCAELQKLVVQATQSIEKSKEAQQKCLDTAGVLINKDSDEQQTNYTEQCVTALTNVTDSGWSGVDKAVQKFVDAGDFTEEINSLLGFNLGEEMEKLKTEYVVHKEDGKTVDNEDDKKDDRNDDKKDDTTPDDKKDDKKDEKNDAKSDDKRDDEKDDEKGDKEDDKKDDKEEDKEKDTEDDKTVETERLFDSAAHIQVTGGAGSAVLTCLFAGVLVAAVGLLALLHRGVGRKELEHESLIGEDTDVAEA